MGAPQLFCPVNVFVSEADADEPPKTANSATATPRVRIGRILLTRCMSCFLLDLPHPAV
jgi:hypothetical protein